MALRAPTRSAPRACPPAPQRGDIARPKKRMSRVTWLENELRTCPRQFRKQEKLTNVFGECEAKSRYHQHVCKWPVCKIQYGPIAHVPQKSFFVPIMLCSMLWKLLFKIRCLTEFSYLLGLIFGLRLMSNFVVST